MVEPFVEGRRSVPAIRRLDRPEPWPRVGLSAPSCGTHPAYDGVVVPQVEPGHPEHLQPVVSQAALPVGVTAAPTGARVVVAVVLADDAGLHVEQVRDSEQLPAEAENLSVDQRAGEPGVDCVQISRMRVSAGERLCSSARSSAARASGTPSQPGWASTYLRIRRNGRQLGGDGHVQDDHRRPQAGRPAHGVEGGAVGSCDRESEPDPHLLWPDPVLQPQHALVRASRVVRTDHQGHRKLGAAVPAPPVAEVGAQRAKSGPPGHRSARREQHALFDDPLLGQVGRRRTTVRSAPCCCAATPIPASPLDRLGCASGRGRRSDRPARGGRGRPVVRRPGPSDVVASASDRGCGVVAGRARYPQASSDARRGRSAG